MNSPAQSNVTNSIADGAVNTVAGIAGKKVADLAMQKVGPVLRSLDTKKIVTLAALAGVGFLVYRAIHKNASPV